MMTYQRFVLTFIIILVLFVGSNFLVWKCWTEDLLTDKKYQGGDLARMGYVDTSKQYRKNSNDLPRRHVELKNYAGGKFDVITIGDSFSNGGAGGKNRFYQDYIASINQLNVLNIPPYKYLEPVSTITVMLNSGFLDTFTPRFVLIGMHESGGLPALGLPLNFSATMSIDDIKSLKPMDYDVAFPNISFINNGNAKFLLYKLLYRLSDHAFFSQVYQRKLAQPMFTAPDDNTLLFLRSKSMPDKKVLKTMNDNLNTLADRLAAKGITLVFMPCVDKFNLYSGFIVNNPYPVSTFFEDLDQLPKRYRFINTKKILLELLRKGEKDIFYADDTHWSYKASEAIFRNHTFD